MEELALCYFKSNKDKEPKGWMFLKDVTDIFEEQSLFTLVSVSRFAQNLRLGKTHDRLI